MSVATVDASSRENLHALVATATRLGELTGLIHAAGVSPSQASPGTILKVDLYGTALVLEVFGNVIARGGAGVVIASQSGIAFLRFRATRTKHWPLHLLRSCSVFLSFRRTTLGTLFTRTSFRSEGIRFA